MPQSCLIHKGLIQNSWICRVSLIVQPLPTLKYLVSPLTSLTLTERLPDHATHDKHYSFSAHVLPSSAVNNAVILTHLIASTDFVSIHAF